MRKDAKDVLIGLECGKVYRLGESVPEGEYEDKVSITTDHGKIDCTYLKEETKLAEQLRAIRDRQ